MSFLYSLFSYTLLQRMFWVINITIALISVHNVQYYDVDMLWWTSKINYQFAFHLAYFQPIIKTRTDVIMILWYIDCFYMFCGYVTNF